MMDGLDEQRMCTLHAFDSFAGTSRAIFPVA